MDLKNEWELARGRKKEVSEKLWQAWHENSADAKSQDPGTKLLCGVTVFVTKTEPQASEGGVEMTSPFYMNIEEAVASKKGDHNTVE